VGTPPPNAVGHVYVVAKMLRRPRFGPHRQNKIPGYAPGSVYLNCWPYCMATTNRVSDSECRVIFLQFTCCNHAFASLMECGFY